MATRLFDPFDALVRLQRAVDSSMGSPWLGASTSARGAFPPVNVFRRDGDYVVVVELPGVGRDNIDLQVQRNQIRLHGQKAATFGEDVSVHRKERVSGAFDRTLTFPVDIEPDGVVAEFRDGILAILVPPAEHERPRTIPVG